MQNYVRIYIYNSVVKIELNQAVGSGTRPPFGPDEACNRPCTESVEKPENRLKTGKIDRRTVHIWDQFFLHRPNKVIFVRFFFLKKGTKTRKEEYRERSNTRIALICDCRRRNHLWFLNKFKWTERRIKKGGSQNKAFEQPLGSHCTFCSHSLPGGAYILRKLGQNFKWVNNVKSDPFLIFFWVCFTLFSLGQAQLLYFLNLSPILFFLCYKW